MSLVESAQSHALDVRNRLRRPSNAVPDRPINLKFKHGIDPSAIKRIEIKTVDSEQETENKTKINYLAWKVASLETQLLEVIHRLNTAKKAPVGVIETPEAPPIIYPSITDVIKIVSAHYGVSRADLDSHRRDPFLRKTRNIGYHLCRLHTLRSYPEIGRMFGGKDHTCSFRGNKKIAAERLISRELDEELTGLSTKIAALTAR